MGKVKRQTPKIVKLEVFVKKSEGRAKKHKQYNNKKDILNLPEDLSDRLLHNNQGLDD